MTENVLPWYSRTLRWGQTNLTEIDPLDYDIGFWREHWRKTCIQGVIINAGGIVAYYPSHFQDQYRAEYLGNRDLFGEIVYAARQEGLAVLARMDSNRATQGFFDRHPDWFAVDAGGQHFITQGRYLACVNSPYYQEYIPEILQEIIQLYHPDGFTDNSWTGLGRKTICHCPHCQRKFNRDTGLALPDRPDWGDKTYLTWVRWSFDCRTANWELNNRITRSAGGEDCLWLGMVNADVVGNNASFCDLKAISERAKMMLSDHQSRSPLHGFEQNSLNGKLLHSLAGWKAVIPESMAHYVRGVRAFRRASNPLKETELWMVEGMAGGISPWWHHIGARQEDSRQFDISVQLMQWHQENEAFLYNRHPVARVGLVWSQDNTVFYGQENAHERVALPWRGFTLALTRARIPFVPVHADHIAQQAGLLDLLILPGLAALSDYQCQALQEFTAGGGSLILTGNTACLDEWGQARQDFPLAEVAGFSHLDISQKLIGEEPSSGEEYQAHNYFRLPQEGEKEPARHPILQGFEKTDILPFGGTLWQVKAGAGMHTLATYISPFPIYPPEFSWMRTPQTDIPAILAGATQGGGWMVYFAGDIDRCYGRAHLPDHGDLLANAIRWAAREPSCLQVDGPGYLDCNLYAQEQRLILHIVNLSGSNPYPGYVEEYLPVGPVSIAVKLTNFIPQRVLLRVAGTEMKPEIASGWAKIQLESLGQHELLIWE
jgi:hypothetical protein